MTEKLDGAFRLHPPPHSKVKEIYGDLNFPVEHPGNSLLPYVIINMVSSLDGKVSVIGKSGAIGSRLDRSVMRTLRSKVDAVMIGAGTLRAEKVSLTSEGRRTPEPTAVIVTSSLDIPMENLLYASKDNTIILVPKGSDKKNKEKTARLSERAEVLPCEADENGIDFSEALKNLKESHEVGSVLLEGGPSISHAFISRDLVAEIFLTLSPKLLGGLPKESIGILSGKILDLAPVPKLLSIHKSESTDELFLRYRIP